MCNDRAAYHRKAMSAGITATGYTPNVVVASSEMNAHNKDDKEAIDDNVPGDVWENLEANGDYNSSADQPRLTGDSSTTAAKKAHKHSKNSSNNKV